MCLYTMIFLGWKPNRMRQFDSFRISAWATNRSRVRELFPYFLTLSLVRDYRKRGFGPEFDFYESIPFHWWIPWMFLVKLCLWYQSADSLNNVLIKTSTILMRTIWGILDMFNCIFNIIEIRQFSNVQSCFLFEGWYGKRLILLCLMWARDLFGIIAEKGRTEHWPYNFYLLYDTVFKLRLKCR